MPRSSVFNATAPARVPRSIFDLSHQHLMTGDLGYLYPVMALDCVPGDVMDISHELVVRFQPLVAPVLHEVNAYVHTFFCPWRLVDSDFEKLVTGGEDGTEAPTVELWGPTTKAVGSLWDHFGFPTGSVVVSGIQPHTMLPNAYIKIYNEWFRDQLLVSEVADITATDDGDIQKRSWEKDYFTSALPTLQKGTAPALPVTLSGTIDVDGQNATITGHSAGDATVRDLNVTDVGSAGLYLQGYPSSSSSAFRWTDPQLEVDISSGTATTFDISDLRLALAQQVILERNNRAGSRYTEWLQAHFRVAPRDERLDRPEFIGSFRAPVIMSEVLQTSASNLTGGSTPLAEQAGHGITVEKGRIGRYRCQEFGVIMSILSVMPRTVYSQGIDRQWIKATKWDFYNPALAHLSEQAVLEGEIYANTGTNENQTIFGYQPRWNEMRYVQSKFVAKMRSGQTFDHWHIGRDFTGRPSLNQTFIECTPEKDYLASSGEDALIVSVGNRVKAARPLPIVADPRLLG